MERTMKVLVHAPVGPYSGYGNDGIGMLQAMMQEGFDPYLLPLSVTPPLPPEIAMLLTRDVETPLDMTIVHADPATLDLSVSAKRATSRAVAWTMWEWPTFAHEPEIAETLPKRLEQFDEVVAYDEVSLTALREVLGDDERLRKVQGGYWSRDWPLARERAWYDVTTRFGMVGALHDRKNPFAAIKAFDLLKQRYGDEFDAQLHLKTVSRTLHPAIEQRYPGVKIHYEVWPQAVMKQFYTSLHCLLAPSRGEGKNLPALEAQSTGIPVAATRIGGHAEWLSEQFAYVIPHETVTDASGKASAEADVEGLAEIMWQVHIDRTEARRRGELAARTIPSMLDWPVVLRRLVTR